jgi:hypothetical protein
MHYGDKMAQAALNVAQYLCAHIGMNKITIFIHRLTPNDILSHVF